MGYTLKLDEFIGTFVSCGILVDDAIVVLENIYRHMEMGKAKLEQRMMVLRKLALPLLLLLW